MHKRISQTTAVNGPIRISPGGAIITRCIDCEGRRECAVGLAWRWPYGPMPMDCPLPRTEEEE